MSERARSLVLLLLVLLALVVGFAAGWRANVTLDPAVIHYVPVPVQPGLSQAHWYIRDWPRGNRE